MNLFALFFHAFLANSIPYRIVKLDPTSSIICFSTKFNQHENMFQDIALLVGLTLIQAAHAKGAVCLDGTLPGYHLHRGYGSGSNSWLINLEGGGWCNDVRTCVYCKTTRRGSSSFMEKEIPFTGILSNNAEENPDFFNWNRVKLRYCDGASFTGDSEDKGVQKNLPRICTNHLDPTSGIAVATKAQFDSTDLALLELAWIQLIQENKPITKKELAESDSQDAYAKKAI